MNLMELSVRGIRILTTMPNAYELIQKLKNDNDSKSKKKLAKLKKNAKFAQKEIDRNFPVLHSQFLVALWAYLEGAIRYFIGEWIKNDPDAYKIPEIQKIKIELAKFIHLGPDDRALYIYDVYEREIVQGLPYGVKRFEKLLQPLGLSGPLREGIIEDFHEMAQIRNAIVHRGGFADIQLIQKCPNLNYKNNQEIVVKKEDFERYFHSVHIYIILLMERVAKKYNPNIEPFDFDKLEVSLVKKGKKPLNGKQ